MRTAEAVSHYHVRERCSNARACDDERGCDVQSGSAIYQSGEGHGSNMKQDTRAVPHSCAAALILCCVAVMASVPLASSASAAPAAAKCAADEYRRFDFWLGDWDSFDVDNGKESPRSVARNRVDAILDGCVLREDYDQFDGMHGQSFTIWDAARGVWHQSWVTNRGQLLQLDGTRNGSRITFEGDSVTPQGRQRVRVFWEPQGADVRETATISADAGKTWKPLFDIVFRKHRG